MKAIDIRNKFIQFFESKGHHIDAGSPVVTKDDPSLLFINSGMAPFKDVFLGNTPIKYPRVTNSQRCIRVSGKHNDLEDVGIDTYHFTLFEMLGCWSFGDYFKQEVIDWAWELLTEVYKIDRNRLYVTVFEGCNQDNVPKDEEAYAFWTKYVSEDRILLADKKDNFWEMGDQSPCGPCSEIHVDLRDESECQKIPAQELVNQDHPQVIEIWNLVFMEYNRNASGALLPLPNKHIDTGMGFERLVMVLQGKLSAYDTDVFQPIIKEIENISGSTYGSDKQKDVAFRVIADHLRTVAFTIGDGQLPSNTGAGYVIRRILRRATRYGYTEFDQKEPFIYKLVSVLASQFQHIKSLVSQAEMIAKIIEEEEASFLKTLDQGLKNLDLVIEQIQGNTFPGEEAFKLYDTYGFPVDLTANVLREKGYTLDEAGFEKEMARQKSQSRKATEISYEDWQEVQSGIFSGFTGYDSIEDTITLLKYRKVVSEKSGTLYQLVFDKTPFYAESGGQVADKGTLLGQEDKEKIEIIDIQKEDGQHIHYTPKLPQNTSQIFKAVVDKQYRQNCAKNHTATHLLHHALKAVLGDHVEQKGSLVNSDYLRFDFSHFSKVTDEELKKVENKINELVSASIDLEEKREVPIKEALSSGANALFGEKYGEKVRVIKFGQSIELCGGTHVQNTLDLFQVIILSERAIASGIRRIEAISGSRALAYLKEQKTIVDQIKKDLKKKDNITEEVAALLQENKTLKATTQKLEEEKIQHISKVLSDDFISKNGISILCKQVNTDAKNLRNLALTLGQNTDPSAVLLGTVNEGKATITCFISKSLVAAGKTKGANEMIDELSVYIDGKGGGQNFFATAAGNNPKGLEKSLGSFENKLWK